MLEISLNFFRRPALIACPLKKSSSPYVANNMGHTWGHGMVIFRNFKTFSRVKYLNLKIMGQKCNIAHVYGYKHAPSVDNVFNRNLNLDIVVTNTI